MSAATILALGQLDLPPATNRGALYFPAVALVLLALALLAYAIDRGRP